MLPKSDQPLPVASQEEFAQAVVRLNNQSAAYREVFGPTTMAPRDVWAAASRTANIYAVSCRIDWLRAQALERSQISVQSLMRDLYDIATADASELTRMIVTACRNCHGDGFEYQWISPDEFAAACEAAAAAKKPLPGCEGGFSFEAHREPHPACPHCYGVGIRTPWVADTTTLTDKARKLFKGIKVKADGSIEILMHDQLAARDQLHKLAGAYKETVKVPERAAEETGPMTPERAERGYMALVRGGKAAG